MDQDDVPAELATGSVRIVFKFRGVGPTFGDLFWITGEEHPNFASRAGEPYKALTSLGFQQMDDYFAIPAMDGEPGVWLYPMVDGYPVEHHPGPFSALEIDFNLLAHPALEIEVFLSVVERISNTLDVDALWGHEAELLTRETLLPTARRRLEEALRHWEQQGITPGTEEAIAISLE